MKAIIFAGGVGTRLWPLSRKKSPKQFEKVIGNKSTLQLTVDRLKPLFAPEDIIISTGSAYVPMIQKQLPKIPKENILGEPAKKDVGPAVAWAMAYVARESDPKEPVVILWSDHLVKHEKAFLTILKDARDMLEKKDGKIVFIGQKPRFASENLGWIEYGELAQTAGDTAFHTFTGFKYRPDSDLAQQYFTSGHHCWNLGYFVSTPEFILEQYQRFTPAIYELIMRIQESVSEAQKNALYEEMPVINFDNAVLEQLDPSTALVAVEDIGWSDVGAWEALKEALEKKHEDNIIQGDVMLEDSEDNLVYNYDKTKTIVGIDLEDLLVVNTKDVLLVSKKTSVAKIKKLVESFAGTEREKLT